MWTGTRSLIRTQDREVAADAAVALHGTVVARSPWMTTVEAGRLSLCLCREDGVLRAVGEFRVRMYAVEENVTVVRELGMDAPIEGPAVVRATLGGLEVMRGGDRPSVQTVLPWLDGVAADAHWNTLELHPLGIRIGYLDLPHILSAEELRRRVLSWTSMAGRMSDLANGSRVPVAPPVRELVVV